MKRQYVLGLVGAVLSGVAVVFSGLAAQASPYGYGAYGSCEYAQCSISVATSGIIDLEAMPTDTGVYTISDDEVEVTTNSSEGYTLILSSASESENSLAGSNGAIAASSGSVADPAVLSVNQWGFRVDGLGGFGAGPTEAITNESSSTLTFAGVPLSVTPTTVRTTSSAAMSGDSTNIWYGVHANNSLPAGIYSATVVYTATMNP